MNELSIEKKIINFINFRNEFNLLTDANHIKNYFHNHNLLISKQTIYNNLNLLTFEQKIYFKYYRKPNAFKKPTKIYFINQLKS